MWKATGASASSSANSARRNKQRGNSAHQGVGVSKVLLHQRIAGHVRQRAQRLGGVQAGVLRADRCSGHEQVRRIPDLTVFVGDGISGALEPRRAFPELIPQAPVPVEGLPAIASTTWMSLVPPRIAPCPTC